MTTQKAPSLEEFLAECEEYHQWMREKGEANMHAPKLIALVRELKDQRAFWVQNADGPVSNVRKFCEKHDQALARIIGEGE